MITFVVKLKRMIEQDNYNGFAEGDDNPLENHGFERVPHCGDFPTMPDLVAMLLIILLTQVVVSLACVALGVPKPQMLSGDAVDIEQFIGSKVIIGQTYAIIYPISMILVFVALYFYIRFRDGKGRVARASTRGFSPNAILGGLVWLIAVQIVVEPVTQLLPHAEQNTGQGFWAIVTAVIFAPVFEELIFRGLVLEALLRRHRRLVCVVVSSAIFALVHFQPDVMLTAFVSGLVLGTIYLHTNSVFSTIILHSINNAIAYSLITLDLQDFSYSQILGGSYVYYGVYALSLIFCGLALYQTWRKR